MKEDRVLVVVYEVVFLGILQVGLATQDSFNDDILNLGHYKVYILFLSFF
jgi:hypothetical protein